MLGVVISFLFFGGVNVGMEGGVVSDKERQSMAAEQIVDGVWYWAVDNRGALPGGISFDDYKLIASGEGNADICEYLVPFYMSEIPVDPFAEDGYFEDCENYNSGFLIKSDSETGKLNLKSVYMEDEAPLVNR